MQNKKILLISPYFAPSSAVGPKRSIKLALAIQKYGWEPYVITMKTACYNDIDPSLEMPELSKISITRVPCGSLWNHGKIWRKAKPGLPLLFAKICRALDKFTTPIRPIDDYFPWSFMATAKAVKLVKDNSIDLVWASVPYWSGMHLAYRTWKRTGVPYILDFRDVRRNQEISKLSAQDRRIIRLESKAIENAAGITYVAPKQIEALNSTHKKSKQMPSKLVYNWVKNFQSRQDSHSGFDNPTIIYGGSLYSGTRKIDGFFEALSKLKTHNKNNEHKVQFRHFGLDNEIGMIKSLSVKYGIDDIVFPSGLITSQKLAAYSHKSDILLLVVGHNTGNVEHANAIPAKLYDYFGAKRPILVLGPKDCEAGNIVQKTNRGIAVDDDDPIGIEKAIKLLLEGKTETGSVDLSDDAISEFSEKTVVTGFVSFIESICN